MKRQFIALGVILAAIISAFSIFPAVTEAAASVVSFTASTPDLSSTSVDLAWKVSDAVTTTLSFDCSLLADPLDQDVAIVNKATGQVFGCGTTHLMGTWTGRTENSGTFQIQNTTSEKQIRFTVNVIENYNVVDSKTQTVTFPPSDGKILSFTSQMAKDMTFTLFWEISRPSRVNLLVDCPQPFDMLNVAKGSTYSYCYDGSVGSFYNQTKGSVTLQAKNAGTYAVPVFTLQAIGSSGKITATKELKVPLDSQVVIADPVTAAAATSSTSVPATSPAVPAPVVAPIVAAVVPTPAPAAAPAATAASVPAPQACYSITSALALGSTDARASGQVSILQAFMKVSGYLADAPSGYFGRMTAKAVKKFQIDADLDITGRLDKKTRAAVNAALCAK